MTDIDHSDITTPFNVFLETIKKEAESVSSARVDEILLLRQRILSILRLPSGNLSQKLPKSVFARPGKKSYSTRRRVLPKRAMRKRIAIKN